jgi:osmoprotectant transport system permease protein
MNAMAAIARSPARPQPHNRVLPALILVAAAAGAGTGFVTLAPNRLMSGMAIPLWRAAGLPLTAALAVAGVSLVAIGFAPRRTALNYGAAVIAGGALLLALAAAGSGAATLAAGAPQTAAISPGAGFWTIFACAALALINGLQRVRASSWAQILAAVLIAAAVAAMAKAGLFDALALAREYSSRREAFGAAVVRHVELVVAGIVPALLIGVPLGLAALRRRRVEAPLFAVLNLLQTVPSIALFGLLIAPLSELASAVPALGALGVAGVGPAPAILALILYALLPIARNTLAGIGGVPPATVSAAEGMGMSRRQVFWQVEVPLALPVLLAGLRIVTVQAIGLAVVAALIGAGGLGTFVFEGLGQYATNVVLLGALPAILMALAADFLLRLLSGALRRRFAP